MILYISVSYLLVHALLDLHVHFQASSLSETKWSKDNHVKLHRSKKDYETIVISSDSSEDEESTENLHVASSAETSKCSI